MHHSYEYTKRWKTFVLMFVGCIAIILIAVGRVWIASISTILRRLDATTKTCMQRMRDIVEHVYARALAKLKQSAIAVLWSVSASIVKGPKNTQSYSLHGFWKGSSQDIKCQKKLFIWSITNVDTKDWFWKYEIAFFCVNYPRCTLLLLFSYKA